MRFVPSAALVLALGAVDASAADPVIVFGLPLGGKPVKQIRICPERSHVTDIVCWVGRPSTAGGETEGYVALPNSALPLWASGLHQLSLGRDGTISRVRIDAGGIGSDQAVIDSISTRFGPSTDQPAGPYTVKFWSRDGLYIRLESNGRDYRKVLVQTGADYAAQQQRAAAYRNSRPATP
jgi:hypothetical protein